MNKSTDYDNLLVVVNNLKSDLIVFQKTIINECTIYKDNLIKYVNEYKNNSYNEIESKSNTLYKDLDLRTNTILKQVDSNINSSFNIFKKNITEYSNIENLKFTIDSLKNSSIENIKNVFSEIEDEVTKETALKLENEKKVILEKINNDSSELESKFINYVSQLQNMIDQSFSDIKNKTLNGLDNIYSAEQTSIDNILKIKNNSINEINSTISNIDIVINEFISGAKDEIDDYKNKVISEINSLDSSIKSFINIELTKSKEEINLLVDKLSTSLEDKKTILEQELIKKSNELLEEFENIEDDFVLELNRIKQEVMSDFSKELSKFFSVMATREQEILSNIMNITSGFKEELEEYRLNEKNKFISEINIIIEEKIRQLSDVIDALLLSLNNKYEELKLNLFNYTNNELITTLDSNKDNALIEINNLKNDSIKKIGTEDSSMYDENTPSIRKEAIDSIKNHYKTLLDSSLENAMLKINEYINSIKEQKYSTEIQKGTKEIQLPNNFYLNDRNYVYLDGILLIYEKHYTINQEFNKIILNNAVIGKTDLTVIDYIQDSEINSIKNKFYSETKKILEENINDLNKEFDQKIFEMNEFKNEFSQMVDVKNKELETNIDEYINEKISEYSTQKYSCILNPGITTIELPSKTIITNRVMVFINGILLNEFEHYLIDKNKKIITLNNSYYGKVNATILIDAPSHTTISYMKNYKETSYNLKLLKMVSEILLPFTIENYNFIKVFINGIKMIENIHFNIDYNANKIILKNYFEYDSDVEIVLSNHEIKNLYYKIDQNTNSINIPNMNLSYYYISVYIDGIKQIKNKNFYIFEENNQILFMDSFDTSKDVEINFNYKGENI